MITRDAVAFADWARARPFVAGAAVPRAVFLVAPEQFRVAAESALDNVYMDLGGADAGLAAAQHARLHAALAEDCPAVVFPGRADTPDAIFPNNVFATARVDGRGRVVIGRMRHAGRRREAERADLRGFFTEVLGYELHDLSSGSAVCELTGSLVIDRGRGIGYCGLSERCDAAGAQAMARAFGLAGMLVFDLAAREYHTNVVMSVLAGRALVIAPDGFADPAVAAAIGSIYPHRVTLDVAQKDAFCGNCIAISQHRVWFSQRAAHALSDDQRATLAQAGFAIGAVALDQVEKAGGSLRCCVGEVF